MNSSWGWPAAGIGAVSTSAASAAIHIVRTLMTLSFCLRSVGKRPEPQLLFRDLPEPRQPARLDDQKEDDQAAEHHQLDLLLERYRKPEPERVGRVAEDDRDQDDERRAEERAQDAAEAADDHHEEHEKRDDDVEGQGLGAAEVENPEPSCGDAAVELADGEGHELRAQRPHSDALGRDIEAADRHPRAAHAPAHQLLR